MQAPIIVVNTKTQRESGRKVQLTNINTAKTVADVIKSCLGPSSMLKMLVDPMGGIVLTNDGNAILREIEAAHPVAKSMIELSRTQDEEVGDGTTSVIVLSGEVLSLCIPHIEKNIHPIIIITGLRKALKDAKEIMYSLAKPINLDDDSQMLKVIRSSLNTKFGGRWADLMCSLALKSVRMIATVDNFKRKEVDIKRYIRIEKITGDEIENSVVLDGIILNKDVTHPKMRRKIENPRILLLDCTLEYKKGESQTNIEISKEGEWENFLTLEEDQIKEVCEKIIAFKPDLVFTEKGISDLAQHHFVKANITAIRRLKKTDSIRIARAVGANIVNRVEDIKETDIGLGCKLFHVEKIADEYFTYLDHCVNPKACSIILRGASKDILNELDRDLQDAICVARNVYYQPLLVPGGGALEMAVSAQLNAKSKVMIKDLQNDLESPLGIASGPYKSVSEALEIIPKVLIHNCGGNVIRTITSLRAKHAKGLHTWGIDGLTGQLIDMDVTEFGIWEPLSVKLQTLQTVIEAACMLLRVDDMLSGVSKKNTPTPPPATDASETFSDE